MNVFQWMNFVPFRANDFVEELADADSKADKNEHISEEKSFCKN